MKLIKKILILTVSLCIGAIFNSNAFSGQIGITEEMVKNISIPNPMGANDELVKFNNGHFHVGEGADDPNYLFGDITAVALGDLTGEGSNDAAFIYFASVGTGKYYSVCVLSGKNGKIVDYDGPSLGSSVKVKKFAIENKKLVIDATYEEKGNWGHPIHIKQSFSLKKNKLVQNVSDVRDDSERKNDLSKSNNPQTLVLTPAKKTTSCTGTFTAPGAGFQKYTIVKIDTTAFTSGGKVKIALEIGNGESAASVDVFAETTPIPTQGRPAGTLGGVYDIPPGKKDIALTLVFKKGGIYQVGITGNWGSRPGATNSFRLNAIAE